MKTLKNLHPKVRVPALTTIAVGAGLVVMGVLLPDAAVRIFGEGAISAGLLGLGVGQQTPAE